MLPVRKYSDHDDFMEAVIYGRTHTLRQHIERYKKNPAIIFYQNSAGLTPMTYAVSRGKIEVVSELLAIPEANNAIDVCGKSPLMWAVTQKFPRIVNILLDSQGIKIDAIDANGNSALHHAVSFISYDGISIIKDLLNHGANTTLKNNLKQTAADMAAITLAQPWNQSVDQFRKRELEKFSELITLLTHPNPILPPRENHSVEQHIDTVSGKNEVIDLRKRLSACLDYTRHLIVGSSNKIEDIERTNGWVLFQRTRYASPGEYLKMGKGNFSLDDYGNNLYQFDPVTRKSSGDFENWFYHVDDSKNKHIIHDVSLKTAKDPIHDSRFKIDENKKILLYIALMVIECRFGNCHQISALITDYFWRIPVGIFRIEAVVMKSFDHIFIIINRKGDLNNSDSWGDDCWVIDGWWRDGIFFPASEFMTRVYEMKQFAKKQLAELEKIHYRGGPYYEGDTELIKEVLWDIKPHSDPYPHYDSKMQLLDYYDHIYLPAEIIKNIDKDKQKHREILTACLALVPMSAKHIVRTPGPVTYRNNLQFTDKLSIAQFFTYHLDDLSISENELVGFYQKHKHIILETSNKDYFRYYWLMPILLCAAKKHYIKFILRILQRNDTLLLKLLIEMGHNKCHLVSWKAIIEQAFYTEKQKNSILTDCLKHAFDLYRYKTFQEQYNVISVIEYVLGLIPIGSSKELQEHHLLLYISERFEEEVKPDQFNEKLHSYYLHLIQLLVDREYVTHQSIDSVYRCYLRLKKKMGTSSIAEKYFNIIFQIPEIKIYHALQESFVNFEKTGLEYIRNARAKAYLCYLENQFSENINPQFCSEWERSELKKNLHTAHIDPVKEEKSQTPTIVSNPLKEKSYSSVTSPLVKNHFLASSVKRNKLVRDDTQKKSKTNCCVFL